MSDTQPINSTPMIEVKGLKTVLGGRDILSDLDLIIHPKEIMAIVGGSGSGKTTLLRSILMLLQAKGSIKIFGHEIINGETAELETIRKNWGVMFQQSALFSSLTVLENIAFPLKEYTDLDKKAINEIATLKLLMVGLSKDAANKYPSELSGGMQKRVALARAIALDPKLLFLDEPTSGLDPKGASGLDSLILHLKENLGLTIVMVTHDLDTLWRVADRVAFLGDGKVLQIGTMNELMQSKNPLVREYFSDSRSMVARNIQT